MHPNQERKKRKVSKRESYRLQDASSRAFSFIKELKNEKKGEKSDIRPKKFLGKGRGRLWQHGGSKTNERSDEVKGLLYAGKGV